MKSTVRFLGGGGFYKDGLTDVLISGRRDDERASSGLLRDSVVVDLPVERVAVLLPAVTGKKLSFRLTYWEAYKRQSPSLDRRRKQWFNS